MSSRTRSISTHGDDAARAVATHSTPGDPDARPHGPYPKRQVFGARIARGARRIHSGTGAALVRRPLHWASMSHSTSTASPGRTSGHHVDMDGYIAGPPDLAPTAPSARAPESPGRAFQVPVGPY